MKKNTKITIDLEGLEFRLGEEYDPRQILDLIYKAAIEPPCTLTETVEKFGYVKIGNCNPESKDFITCEIRCKKEVEQFKSQYLDKEETLEDGIYESEIGNNKQIVYVRDGMWATVRFPLVSWKATDLINPVKIAEI